MGKSADNHFREYCTSFGLMVVSTTKSPHISLLQSNTNTLITQPQPQQPPRQSLLQQQPQQKFKERQQQQQ